MVQFFIYLSYNKLQSSSHEILPSFWVWQDLQAGSMVNLLYLMHVTFTDTYYLPGFHKVCATVQITPISIRFIQTLQK